jgi:alpha-beta hydrolase superfamily lysophospholipase
VGGAGHRAGAHRHLAANPPSEGAARLNTQSRLPGTDFPGFEIVPSQPCAGLLYVHGIAEHGGRYRHVAHALAEHGIASFSYDQRGHGLTSGARTHVDDFELFASDLLEVYDSVARRHPMPLFVWGHSMGSVITTLGALKGLKAPGYLTSGAAFDALPSLTGWRGAALNVANSLLPRLRVGLRIDSRKLMQEQAAQRAHMSDPLVPRSASLRLLHGFARACGECKGQLPRLKAPWLALHGGADPICPVSGSEHLIKHLGSTDKQLLIFPGLLHEPHNEAEAHRSRMFLTMAQWILARA